ncbi:MAG: hypothetical protein JKY56_10405 [Kofleriaceae bacterium]|nr:hypothetical protein [Kofleriaceae bacterium]
MQQRRIPALLSFLLMAVLALPAAHADEQPESMRDLKKYKFVVEGDDYEYTMQIVDKKYGLIGNGKDGFIKYRLATWKGKEIVQINMIEGVRKVKGVGEALKKEVMRRHSGRTLLSDLVSVNRSRLLREWAKGYPHSASDKDGSGLSKVVPAMKFEGFNYTITPKVASSGIGGRISMEMEAARKGRDGSIRITDPIALDKILATTEPELIRAKDRPKTAKDVKEDERENKDGAKKAARYLKELADDVADDEGVKERDLLKYLWKAMDDECGRGGSDGSGWVAKCLFTKKGRSYVVKSRNSRSSFYLNKKMEDEAEDFVDDNK